MHLIVDIYIHIPVPLFTLFSLPEILYYKYNNIYFFLTKNEVIVSSKNTGQRQQYKKI
jgi:hypothetical protein